MQSPRSHHIPHTLYGATGAGAGANDDSDEAGAGAIGSGTVGNIVVVFGVGTGAVGTIAGASIVVGAAGAGCCCCVVPTVAGAMFMGDGCGAMAMCCGCCFAEPVAAGPCTDTPSGAAATGTPGADGVEVGATAMGCCWGAATIGTNPTGAGCGMYM